MTQEELITKQQLEIEHFKQAMTENKDIALDMAGYFVAIGMPLNDNVLGFNKAQLAWCQKVYGLIESLNVMEEKEDY